MKNNLTKVILAIILLFSTFLGFSIKVNKNVYASNLSSDSNALYKVNKWESKIVIESKTHRILYQKNAFDKKFMASTTKILTAITAIENCDITEKVIIPKEATGIEGSSIYLTEGEELTVQELLYGLMLRSGNDCAVAISIHVGKSFENFVNMMNQTAKKAGATNSNFVNPHGLHDDNHYTTAYDMALISSYAMRNQTFRDIVKTKSVTINNTKGEYKRILKNKNKMLFDFDGCNGIKTGYTKNSGRCLVSSAVRNGMELISVVLNVAPMWEVSKNNLNDCFDNYNLYKQVESDEILDFVDINGQKIGLYTDKDIYLPLKTEETNKIHTVIELFDNIKTPIAKNSNIGKIKFYIENNLIYEQKIYNIISVE